MSCNHGIIAIQVFFSTCTTYCVFSRLTFLCAKSHLRSPMNITMTLNFNIHKHISTLQISYTQERIRILQCNSIFRSKLPHYIHALSYIQENLTSQQYPTTIYVSTFSSTLINQKTSPISTNKKQ